jgi:hypothetical protein
MKYFGHGQRLFFGDMVSTFQGMAMQESLVPVLANMTLK